MTWIKAQHRTKRESLCSVDGKSRMSDVKVFRWTGVFGLGVVVFWLSQFPLYMVGDPPSVYDGLATSWHLKAIHRIAFTRIPGCALNPRHECRGTSRLMIAESRDQTNLST
jgi:hypothetical protein